jgi:hypothetical protein
MNTCFWDEKELRRNLSAAHRSASNLTNSVFAFPASLGGASVFGEDYKAGLEAVENKL